MAVDASQFLTNREFGNFVEGNENLFAGFPMGYGLVQGPVSGTTTATEALMPMYGLGMGESVYPMKASVKSESGVSYAIPVSRKRPREASSAAVNNNNQQFLCYPPGFVNQPSDINHQSHHQHHRPSFNFLSEDFSLHFHQQQSEIDRLIAQHTLKVRLEMEEKRKRYSRSILTAVEDVIVKKLRAKEEEIDKIGKINWALEEKVKSLCVENQIWRELAQTNEATANALRSNLEQVLAHIQEDQQQQQQQQRHNQIAAAELADDAESCCGSNCFGVAAAEKSNNNNNNNNRNTGGAVDSGEAHGGRNMNRMCRNCGKEEATVLIMPCRHLCLCYLCGPLLQNCPICNSAKNVMVRVNLVS